MGFRRKWRRSATESVELLGENPDVVDEQGEVRAPGRWSLAGG